jgi:hypothetical protein
MDGTSNPGLKGLLFLQTPVDSGEFLDFAVTGY